MDLGLIQVRCQGVNILHGAIHEQHGVAWSDGQGIFLTPVSLFQGQVEHQEHSKLGEFTVLRAFKMSDCIYTLGTDLKSVIAVFHKYLLFGVDDYSRLNDGPMESRGVKSIHWSDNTQADLCYMCVVHERNISIWKVEGRQPKLAFKQIRKINIQPVPQGCLWNPRRDVLCVLCPQQSSLYYSHIHNKGSQVLVQLERDKIRCGCWTTDGLKLVICIGTSLMVYDWSDIDSSVTQYTTITWTVPGLSGHLSSIVAVNTNRVITAAELPLESLCKQQDTFLIPDSLNSNSNGPISEELKDAEIIIPKGNGSSITDSLLNLQRNPNTLVEDSSRIDCIELREEKNPVRLCSISVKGVLTPDLLLYVEGHSLLVVGSNSQTVLQIFSYNKDQLSKYQEIIVNKDERPKGVASLPKSVSHNCGILIVLGKKDVHDSAFPSSSSYINMKSVMKFFHIKQDRFEKNQLTHTVSAPSIPLSVATNGCHDDKDYDSIYEKVINFDTKLKNGVSGLSRSENKENNNSVKIEEIVDSEQKKGDAKVLNEIAKQNGVDNHVNTEACVQQNGGAVDSEPPKRPVRKKKSMRQGRDEIPKRDELAKRVSSSSEKSETKSEMPMEYLSDSPEMSPRDCGRKNVRSDSVTNESVPITVRGESAGSRTNSDPNIRLPGNDMKPESQYEFNKDIAGVNQTSEQSLPPHRESSGEITTLKLGVNNNAANLNKSPIIEIGDDTNNAMEKVLEIEKVDFLSQKSNFKHGDIQTLYTEESQREKVMEDYCDTKLKSLESFNNHIPDVAGAQSVSMESLEDIDKILKEQNGKITKLQEQMSKLSRRIDESTCVLPYRYRPVNKPDLVLVCFCCKDGYKIEKKFLLDNGRLQLEQIKQAFSLETVEIFIDDEACVVGCNIDGYIPLKFEPGSSVNIRGKPALT